MHEEEINQISHVQGNALNGLHLAIDLLDKSDLNEEQRELIQFSKNSIKTLIHCLECIRSKRCENCENCPFSTK
jgi:hypothetical protein